MKKYIIKCKNLETKKEERLSSYEMKSYNYAQELLKEQIIKKRIELSLLNKDAVLIDEDEEKVLIDENTDFEELNIYSYEIKNVNDKDYTEIIKGFIEVYEVEKKEGTYNKKPIKTYEFSF